MSMEKSTRTRFATIVILLMVLATGSILGVAADRRLQARPSKTEAGRMQEEGSRSGGRGGEERADSTSSRNHRGLIVEQVDLTEAQHAEIDSIVAHHRQRMRELQEELEEELRQAYQPRYRGLLEQTREDIKAVLTPGQRAAYDSLLAEYDRRRQERRDQDSVPDSRGRGE